MTFLQQITPIVLTWNEEPNIRRVLDKLSWAREVLIVDSGSTDGTLEALKAYSNVRLVTHPFRSFADQWNFALDACSQDSDWVLTLDADYVLSDDLVDEMRSLSSVGEKAGYAAGFTYWTLGKPLRSSLYPPRIVLFRRSLGRFLQEGHMQVLSLHGPVRTLRAPISHDDRKPLSRWLSSQDGYASSEVERLARLRWSQLDWADRLRKAGLAPLLVAFYCLFAKRGLLDGRAGLYYATQRAIAEAVLTLKLWDRS